MIVSIKAACNRLLFLRLNKSNPLHFVFNPTTAAIMAIPHKFIFTTIPQFFIQKSIATSVGELACTYAALILHDDGIPITAEKIATVVKSADLTIEPYWPSLFAKLCEKRNIEDLVMNVGSGGGAVVAVSAPAGGASGGAAVAPAVEEKKEEAKEESDDNMGFGLFD